MIRDAREIRRVARINNEVHEVGKARCSRAQQRFDMAHRAVEPAHHIAGMNDRPILVDACTPPR